MFDYTDQANAAQALAEAASSTSAVSPEVAAEAAWSGAPLSAIAALIQGSQRQYAQGQQLQAERGNMLAKLRAAAAMQGPELANKVQVAQIGAQRPSEAGLWALLRAQELNRGRTDVQGMRGQQAQTVQGMRGEQANALEALRGQNRQADINLQAQHVYMLQQLKGATLEQLKEMDLSGKLDQIKANQESNMALRQLIADKTAEREAEARAWKEKMFPQEQAGRETVAGIKTQGQLDVADRMGESRERAAATAAQGRRDAAATAAEAKKHTMPKLGTTNQIIVFQNIKKALKEQYNKQYGGVWPAGAKRAGEPFTEADYDMFATKTIAQQQNPDNIEMPTGPGR